MSLVDSIRADVQRITSNVDEFATPIVFESPFNVTATIPGTRTKHHLGMSREGLPVNSKTASITISEYAFGFYPFRNSRGEVELINHRVSFADSSGTTHKYIIAETFPDLQLGLIVCLLRDFE